MGVFISKLWRARIHRWNRGGDSDGGLKRTREKLLAVGVSTALTAALLISNRAFAQQAASASPTPAAATRMGAVAGYGLRAFEFDKMDPGMADAMCSGHMEMASMSGSASMSNMGSMNMGGMGNME